MKTKIAVLALLACGLCSVSEAAPIKYDVTYTATLGPNGVGSFYFDNAVGAITNFDWNFGGITGSFGDQFDTHDVFGDTFGRFVFELLAQVDVHSGANCLGSCGAGEIITDGAGPFGAYDFNFTSTYGPVTYFFDDITGKVLATGSVNVTQAVPEPATFGLFLIGLVGAFARRQRLRS